MHCNIASAGGADGCNAVSRTGPADTL